MKLLPFTRGFVVLSLLLFAPALGASISTTAQTSPEGTAQGAFSEPELIKGLAGGMSNKHWVDLVGEYGVEFSLSPEIEERLRAVGADDELLEAIRKGKAKPLSEAGLLQRLAGGKENRRLAIQVGQYGVEFSLTREIEERLRAAGADDELVEAIRNAKATPKAYFGSIPDFGKAENGVKFADVRPGSPAAKAGLLPGDIVIQFGEMPVKNLQDFTYALRKSKVGDVVEVKVLRGDKPITAKVTLEQRR